MVLVLLVAGFFLLFAAQSNLAFLGMWRCSTRPDLAELLPFDADAGSSSNMVSSQPGRPLGLQSWEIGAGELNFYGVREKRGGRVVDLTIKNMARVSLALSWGAARVPSPSRHSPIPHRFSPQGLPPRLSRTRLSASPT